MEGTKIRPAEETDAAFILAVLSRQLLEHSRSFDNVVCSAFFVRAGLDLLICSGDVTVVCAEEHPQVILGFALANPTTLWYVYVKDAYRGEGVATMLLKHLFDGRQILHVFHTPNLWYLKRSFPLVYEPKLLKPLTGG